MAASIETNLWYIYENMFRSRLFEEATTRAWNEGSISGEMHLSVGEEAIVAGTVLQLQAGDAMALDHRGTAPLVMRGVDPVLLFREFLGHPNGLCAGQGGHMHLFSKEHFPAANGRCRWLCARRVAVDTVMAASMSKALGDGCLIYPA